MMALWAHVGRGEIVNSETGDTNYFIDWQALQVAFHVKHDLVMQDEPAMIWEALLAIKGQLQEPGIRKLYNRGDE